MKPLDCLWFQAALRVAQVLLTSKETPEEPTCQAFLIQASYMMIVQWVVT